MMFLQTCLAVEFGWSGLGSIDRGAHSGSKHSQGLLPEGSTWWTFEKMEKTTILHICRSRSPGKINEYWYLLLVNTMNMHGFSMNKYPHWCHSSGVENHPWSEGGDHSKPPDLDCPKTKIPRAICKYIYICILYTYPFYVLYMLINEYKVILQTRLTISIAHHFINNCNSLWSFDIATRNPFDPIGPAPISPQNPPNKQICTPLFTHK